MPMQRSLNFPADRLESGSSLAPPERAAAVVAVITIGSRMTRLIRTAAVTSILGVTYLGNTYATANTIPNLFFEILAGGALAAALVPALAGPASKGNLEETSERASTFLNLTLLILTPAVVLGLLMRAQLM